MLSNASPPALDVYRSAVREARSSLDAWFSQDVESRREAAASLRALLRQAEQEDADWSVTNDVVQAVRDLICRQGTRQGSILLVGGHSPLGLHSLSP